MKHYVSLLLCCLCATLTLQAQSTAFEGTIVDAQTRQPLSFATIYINKERQTIANAEGGFVLKADSSDVARFTYVGYKTRSIVCGQLPPTVLLEPIEQKLNEVVVLPYPLKKFIKNVTKETLRQLQKFGKKESSFFYRQTAFAADQCYELVEAFLTGKPAVSLRNLQLTTGRYAGLRPDSTHEYSFYGNFFTFSQVDFAMKQEWPGRAEDIVPLFRNYDTYYDIDYDIIGNAPERLIALHFEPKPEVGRAILAATIFVDEKTLHVRKLQGQGRYIPVLHSKQVMVSDSVSKYVEQTYLTAFNFEVHMAEDRGFEEVNAVYVAETHLIDSIPVTTRSIIYNLSGRQQELPAMQPKRKSDKKELKFGDNLHLHIDQQDYDSLFWRENEIVRRTPIEHRVFQIFENNKLFGVWK